MKTCISFHLVVMILCLTPAIVLGQEKRHPAYLLTLPDEIKKPELPRSDQRAFEKIPDKGVLLEILLHEDGSITSFGKRTLSLGGIKVHSKKIKDNTQLRELFYYAVKFGKKESKVEGALGDVDVVVFSSPKTPLYHLNNLMMIACDFGININRFHFMVRDEKTKKEGCLSYYVPHRFVRKDDPKEKELLSKLYIISLYNDPKGPCYIIEYPPLKKMAQRSFFTLKDLQKEVDAIQEKDQKAYLTFCLGGNPAEIDDKSLATTFKDLIDVLTFLKLKGADLKNPKTLVEEIVEIEDN